MEEKKKEFDAVKMMRDARDRISRDIQDMTHEEQVAYFRVRARQVRMKVDAAQKSQAV
jgi:hypothetical protein